MFSAQKHEKFWVFRLDSGKTLHDHRRFDMADEKTILQYKGHPLMRKDNMIYYGSMADSHIVMLQILETKKVQDTDIATKVSVELQLTDPNARAKDRIVKKSEKDGFFTALDLGSVWLARALAAKK
jgi:hypothetical protein